MIWEPHRNPLVLEMCTSRYPQYLSIYIYIDIVQTSSHSMMVIFPANHICLAEIHHFLATRLSSVSEITRLPRRWAVTTTASWVLTRKQARRRQTWRWGRLPGCPNLFLMVQKTCLKKHLKAIEFHLNSCEHMFIFPSLVHWGWWS